MSVPSWRRKLSSTQYLHEIFVLNKTIARIVTRKPSKYRANYGDYLIKEGLDALRLAQIANRTYVTDQISYELRRSSLLELLGVIDNISTTAYIFLELVKQSDSVSNDKIYNEENCIGESCAGISKLVNGVLRSDKERFTKMKK